ncbi:unnamed protein product [Hyaloperonospora brassicae]|uniref:NTF2 domain-containing protein n=1 Tax=Hyaloperonospora brassicae TaxID=162125 RepID=A0AAV0UYS2_HYABA|nr:unnamed protein product [Hyaloperonospora brassicae]
MSEMPASSAAPAPHDDAPPSPRTVGNTFMRQYYHFLAKDPQSLHRFYKTESRWCHGVGSHMEEPIAGQRAINDAILQRGYAGARVELDAGSIDCQQSLQGGVFVLVTGVMTLRGAAARPKPFVQTFFLAVQPKGYFVLNDCLRFLELPRAEGELKEEQVLDTGRGRGEQEVKARESTKKVDEAEGSAATIGATAAAGAGAGAEVSKTVETEVVEELVAEGGVEGETVTLLEKTTQETASGAVTTVNKEVVVETTSAAPVSSTSSSSSGSATGKTTTVTTTTTTTVTSTKAPEGDVAPAAVKTLSPVKACATTTQEGKVATAPADPVVPAPAEPEKPKTWAALFSASTPVATGPPPAAVVPQAAAPVKPVSTKDVATPSASPAPTAAPPSSGGLAPERSPKSKPSKDKEQKRLYSLFIRDLPPQMRDSDLRDLFKGYGSIAGVNVVAQRNFAFVDYYEQESMRAALAETKEFKVLDKVLQVSERGDRKDAPRSGFRGNDSRGRGRGHGPKSGRGGDRKERSGDDAPPFSKGERREGPRREKTGNRRGGKVDATSHNRAE